MSTRLLHLQTSLLEYLTSAAAIFGDRRVLPADHDLHGVDIGRLRFEARFSFDKRLAKISSVFPRTFAIFTGDWAPVLREFVDAQPPMDIGRLRNAQQFFDFLSERLDHAQMEPPWLLDVAACELACAQVRAHAKVGESAIADPVPGALRCRPGAVLLRCTHDVRPVFEDRAGDCAGDGAGVKRHTLLVVFIPPHVDGVQICDVGHEVFDLLAACRQWTDPATLGLVRGSDELVSDLSGRGLLEVR
jgi:hypothetical protein